MQQVEQLGGGLDLLLTDLSLPGGSGLEIARTVATSWPSTAVLVMSGYADTELPSELPLAEFLQKPFTRVKLSRKVREALDRRRKRGD